MKKEAVVSVIIVIVIVTVFGFIMSKKAQADNIAYKRTNYACQEDCLKKYHMFDYCNAVCSWDDGWGNTRYYR